jgi:hypothetical protein
METIAFKINQDLYRVREFNEKREKTLQERSNFKMNSE